MFQTTNQWQYGPIWIESIQCLSIAAFFPLTTDFHAKLKTGDLISICFNLQDLFDSVVLVPANENIAMSAIGRSPYALAK